MDETKQYWRCPEERDGDEAFARRAKNEFSEELNRPAIALPRRDFLKVSALIGAAAAATGCTRAPVEKAIPMLVAAEELVPGVALQYASTCAGCNAGCGVLIKTREGRPVKLEGNPDHPLSRGGLCAVGQAWLAGLYDSQRLRKPMKDSNAAGWSELDSELRNRFDGLRKSGRVRILTGTIHGPTTRALLAQFTGRFADAKHIAFDALSSSAIQDAHLQTHGARVLPRYAFDKAEAIVSFDADFLGTWISPVEFTRGYHAGRTLEGNPPRMSWHMQIESRLSLTGANADQRAVVAPGEISVVLAQLADRIAARSGDRKLGAPAEGPMPPAMLDKIAERLWAARGRSLIVCGVNDLAAQVLTNWTNHLLGNYGNTIDVQNPSQQRQGSDSAFGGLAGELRANQVDALIVQGANPAFDFPELKDAIARVPLHVSISGRMDETASLARYVCAESHPLECWQDYEPAAGVVAIGQPGIRPLGDTRAFSETLSAWMGLPASSYELVQAHWKSGLFPRQKKHATFQAFWDNAVHDGIAAVDSVAPKLRAFDLPSVSIPTRPDAGLTLLAYAKPGMLDGQHSYNAFLHELPDPISKVAWDNYACLSPATAQKFGVTDGDVVVVETPDAALNLILPALVQPGQHDSVVAVALGYGSTLSRSLAGIGPRWLESKSSVNDDGTVGRNVAPFLHFEAGLLKYDRVGLRLYRTGDRQRLANVQGHHSLVEPKLPVGGGQARPLVRELTLAALATAPAEPNRNYANLWPADHENSGPRWGMAIDMNACTGCSGCIVACQVENNIPVVGKDEMARNREMHWLRLDRYYAETGAGVDVVYQPMFCQQCGNAPCETVCPVLATIHSAEGLNQQVYNRCVGTRYCANNCPYKARRFNWFDYAHEDQVQNLMLNPDVTVRSRGVMEKCTFCVQRIQAAKIAARGRGEQIRDGDIQTACQQSCPAEAIVFGDLSDPKSRVSQAARNHRGYRVLEELGVKPAISYLAVVRNREEQGQEHHG